MSNVQKINLKFENISRLSIFGLVEFRERVEKVEGQTGDLGDVPVPEFLSDAVRDSGTENERVVDGLGLEDLLNKRREKIRKRKTIYSLGEEEGECL